MMARLSYRSLVLQSQSYHGEYIEGLSCDDYLIIILFQQPKALPRAYFCLSNVVRVFLQGLYEYKALREGIQV